MLHAAALTTEMSRFDFRGDLEGDWARRGVDCSSVLRPGTVFLDHSLRSIHMLPKVWIATSKVLIRSEYAGQGLA